MSLVLKQTTQFTIRELKLITKFGIFDISAIFQELNVYDSLLMPCMTGNIVIKDSVGLSKRLSFDGSEYIRINIVKGEDNAVTTINKTFRIRNWKKIFPNSDIFSANTISPNHIIQGGIGTCYFLSARSASEDFNNQKHIVIGYTEQSKDSYDILVNIYKNEFPNSEISVLKSEEASLVKLGCNILL
jgi:hypothetical protein